MYKYYGLMRSDGRLFAYTSGHFDFVEPSEIERAYLSNAILSIHTAAQQAAKEGHETVPVEIVFEIHHVDQSTFANSINELIRAQALAKLSAEERAALGFAIR